MAVKYYQLANKLFMYSTIITYGKLFLDNIVDVLIIFKDLCL